MNSAAPHNENTLTEEQTRAKTNLLARLSLGARHVSLTGYAGTGKTFLAGDLIQALKDEGQDVYPCAPTHKAAYVLSQKLGGEAQTVHSFLGLKMRPDGRGGYSLYQDGRHTLPETGVVVLDESSMVGSLLWRHIDAARGLQWIFVGDPAQLPPVKEKPSPALSVPGAHLDTIVRQAEGNPILQMASRVRQGEEYLSAASFEAGAGVVTTRDSSAFLRSVLRGFKDLPHDRPPDVRVLAYRNAVVRWFNRAVRRELHGAEDLPRFLLGDWLMMLETFMEGEVQVCKNSEEVRVLCSRESEWVGPGGFWKCHLVTVEREGGETAILPVLHETERDRYEKTLARFKHEAIEDGRPWGDYYGLRELFAEVDYAFAMTVHKSQGSTFRTAYVEHRDLLACRKPDERQALVYVAATRPSERLALLV